MLGYEIEDSIASPLAEGRGLKYAVCSFRCAFDWSPLAEGRGLKWAILGQVARLIRVAPRRGAWIEIIQVRQDEGFSESRPSQRGVD